MKWRTYTFHEFQLKDLYEILKLRTEIFVKEQECPYQEIDDRDDSAYHITGKEEGELIAYARVLPAGMEFPEVSIGRVAVRMDQRKKGFGDEIFKKTLNTVKNKFGEVPIMLCAQTYLVDFYEKYGFEKVGKEFVLDGIEHVKMKVENSNETFLKEY
ncbi:MAG: GNAT family N-acetyltransferase [Flavobacteriales bacterium]